MDAMKRCEILEGYSLFPSDCDDTDEAKNPAGDPCDRIWRRFGEVRLAPPKRGTKLAEMTRLSEHI
jgi:hypothetical protein